MVKNLGIPEIDLLRSLADQGDIQQVKEIVSKSSSTINVRALYFTLLAGDFRVADVLINAGIPVNSKISDVTMLSAASARGRIDMVNFLLLHGADPYLPDGNTHMLPIDIAQAEGHADIVQLLIKYMSAIPSNAPDL
jgi:ankyrin repeat protein